MRFRLPLLRRQVRILRSPLACSAPVPTRRGTGGSAVRRAGSTPARQLPPTRQREPLCRDPSRLDARSPRTPRDARIRATGRPTGPLQRATHGFPCHARTSSLCWCIPQAAVRYAAATRAVDAGQASRRNVGVSADNDCLGSRQSGTTIPLRHQGVTRRVFSKRLAGSRPDAASTACHYPFPPPASIRNWGSDRRQRLNAPTAQSPPGQDQLRTSKPFGTRQRRFLNAIMRRICRVHFADELLDNRLCRDPIHPPPHRPS